MILLLQALGQNWLLENPASSCILNHPWLHWALRLVQKASGKETCQNRRLHIILGYPIYLPVKQIAVEPPVQGFEDYKVDWILGWFCVVGSWEGFVWLDLGIVFLCWLDNGDFWFVQLRNWRFGSTIKNRHSKRVLGQPPIVGMKNHLNCWFEMAILFEA